MKPKILRIVAHGDWDGVVGAGLFSRIHDLPLEFPLELLDLTIENAVSINNTRAHNEPAKLPDNRPPRNPTKTRHG